MPELPEVETIRRGLEPAVIGRCIVDVRSTPEGERLLQGAPFENFRSALAGRTISSVGRRGKYLIFKLEGGGAFVAHLRMTGRFEVERCETPEGRFFRAAVVLDNGRELRWRDVRRFGTWTLVDDYRDLETRLGPEPLSGSYTAEVLARTCSGRRTTIKALLLDQRKVAGLGNIYVDEALHRARIYPGRPAGTLDGAEIGRLHRAVRAVLRRGIENFGTTMRDFVNAYGEEGRNREHLQVYGRAGAPCFRCGETVRRIVLAGRGTAFCPRCQPERRPATTEDGMVST